MEHVRSKEVNTCVCAVMGEHYVMLRRIAHDVHLYVAARKHHVSIIHLFRLEQAWLNHGNYDLRTDFSVLRLVG